MRNGDVQIPCEGIDGEGQRRARRFSLWPWYSHEAQAEIHGLLSRGGALSAYRSNMQSGIGPKEGSKVYRFERAMEAKFGVRHCVAVNSGTMALTAAIVGLNLPQGSEIITTPLSFSATPASIMLAGHVPVFADVDPETFCLDPNSVKSLITTETEAILPVDLFGQLADYDALLPLGLPIIQDNCQAVGATREGMGIYGHVSCGSGNGQKNLPVGEGGWILTDSDAIAERSRKYISHGENFGDASVGMNGRMHELVGILAYHGLLSLDSLNQRRRELATLLMERINGQAFQGTPGWEGGEDHVFYVFPLLYVGNKKSRERICHELRQAGVEIGEGYIRPTLDRYSAFSHFRRADLKVTHWLSETSLCILPQVRAPILDTDIDWLATQMIRTLSE